MKEHLSKITIEIELGEKVPKAVAQLIAGMIKAQYAKQLETMPEGTKININIT